MRSGLPAIAIVTPSFNQGRFLDETIRSVLNQNYPALHYSVMDGGSTDDSVSIIRNYSNQLNHWQSCRDNGQADAIASGFEQSDADVLGWLNSDDFLLPGALKTVGEFFAANPDSEVVSCGCLTCDESSRYLRNAFGISTRGVAATYDRLRFLETQDGVYQPATFWRRTAYSAVGGLDRSLQFIMDLDLFTKLARRKQFARVRQYVACFRVHGESKSSRIQSVREEELKSYRNRFGTSSYPLFYRRLRFAQYRVPSLMRKLGLRVEQYFEPKETARLLEALHV